MKNNRNLLLSDTSMTIGSFAIQAMLYEVSCYPSPGLVSPVSSGAHKDMNYYTFIDSTTVLCRYLPLLVQEGYSDKPCKDVFQGIRTIGVEAEKEMLIRTKGINTHKGMLFLMGVSCAAIGKALYEKRCFRDIKRVIMEMTSGIVEKELSNLEYAANLSHGEKLYLKYKNTGVRGETERGIPTVFDFALDFYRMNKDLELNDRLVHTLIGIMQFCDDSTIIHRHNPQVLEEVKKKAQDIVNIGGMRTDAGRNMIYELNNEFIIRNISPGGSADLLGVTVFLSHVEEYFNESNLSK